MGSSGAAREVRKSYFDVLGLCCSSEVPLIEKILKQLDGIKEVTVIVPTRTVIVVHDNILISQVQIVKALNQARLEANIRVYGEQTHRMKWPSPYTIGCGVLLMVSFFKSFYHPLQWVAIAAVIVGLAPIGLRSIAAIRNFTLDINILILIAVGGSIALKDYLEAGTIVFLFTIAEWLESKASFKATEAMTSLLSMAPQQATLADSGAIIDAKDVKVNMILAVKAGEVIPIDGTVVEGVCEVDEKTLTGESIPVSKQKDSNVWAGTINLNGYITVKTTALAEECVVAKMAMLVEEAQNNKSRTQRLIDDCTKYYTPFVVSVALTLAVIPAALKLHNLQRWFHLALVVLVSACPCALILSTPVATFCTLTKAAATGVLIKGGDYLEILAQIKTMAFDKTGTITRGEFVVTDFKTLSHDVSLNTLLYWISSIESKSSHPMAAALVDYARSNSIQPKPENVTEFENFPGEGIFGEIDGKTIFVGNKKISKRAGSETVPVGESDTINGGATVGYIYLGGKLGGIFSLSDVCRSGVVDAITELKKMNIKTVMLTGDSNAAAIHAQQQLGHAIEVVHAELLPEDKARIITNLKKEQPTAMVGDGINDAPALATADIGISMGISGSALATETGHVTLMSNDIRKLPQAIKLARKSRRKVIENIIISISTKVAVLALACSGHPLLWAAVLVDVGTCIVVILNSMLLLRGTSSPKSHSPSHAHKHNSGDGCGHHHKKSIPSKSSTCCNPDPVSEQCCSHEILHCEHGEKIPSSSHVHKHNSGDGCGHHHKRSVLFRRSKCNEAPVSEQCCAHQVSQCESGKKSPSLSHAHTHNSGDGCGHHHKGSVPFLPSKCNNSAPVEQCCSNEVPHCGSGPKSPPPPHGHEHNSGDGCDHHSRPVAFKSLSCNHSAPTIHEQCCSDEVPLCGNGSKSSSSSSSTHSHEHKSEVGCEHHKRSDQVKSSNCGHLATVHGQCCSDEVPHSGNSACASSPPTCSESAHPIPINCEISDHNDEPESKCEVQEVEDGGCCKGQCSDMSTLCHAKEEHKVSRGINHCESVESHACMSLERREIGGCCRSFMKECEGKHQCLGAKLGLSEIIIAK